MNVMARKQQSEIVQQLLQLPEWDDIEFKRAQISPKRLLETTCAIANSDGGHIIVGIEDASKTHGIDRVHGINKYLDNISEFNKLLRTDFDPPLQHYVSGFFEEVVNHDGNSDQVYIIRILKADDIHSLKNGDTYIRRGSQNVKIGAQEILRRRYEKGSIKFEDEGSGITKLNDLDEDLIAQFQKDTGSTSGDVWQFLKDNGLVKKTKRKTTLTNGAVLLFGKNPAVLLRRKCSIRVSHYHGTIRSFTESPNFVRRPFTIEGPLHTQINSAVAYFQQAVKESSPKLQDGTFRPSLLIPEWVFQEAIANAVIHRNYAVQNDIQVRFFDDRVEIESPGTYPAHITSSNLRTERFARNPILQRALSRFQEAPNLDIGEGVNRMYELMKKNNLYEPIYYPVTAVPNAVRVSLINMHKIDYWDIVSRYLDSKGKITNKEMRHITGIEDTLHVTRLLNEWVSNKLLDKKGGKTKGAYYIKTGQDLPSLLFESIEK